MKRGFAALLLFLTMGATAVMADSVGNDTTEVGDTAVVADSGTDPAEADSAGGMLPEGLMEWPEDFWLALAAGLAVAAIVGLLAWFRKVLTKGAKRAWSALGKSRSRRSFEKRYLESIGRKYRHLELFGLKTRTPVSIELRKVYVPLKAVKPGDKRWKYTGDIESEPSPMPDPLDQRRLHKDEREERSKDIKVDTASLLRREKLLMILGGPGCGKTTFVGLLALAFATNNQRDWLGVFEHKIPICIPCRDLNPAELPNASEFGECCLPDLLKEDDPGDYFKSLLDKGDCLILIDGLDEVPTVENRRTIVKWIHDLVTVCGNNQFVVTSRIIGYEQAPVEAGFAHYYVSDFDRNDVADFTKKWYETIETTLKDDSDQTLAEAVGSADKLIKTIEKNDRIKRLASNPLLLSIIATVHRYAGRLPDNRAKLYSDCVDLLLGSKDEALGVELKLRAEQKLEVLKPIAHYLACREKRNIPLKDLKHEIGRYLPGVATGSVTVDDFITEVKNRSGLLVESGQDVFGFSHLTFQEYLVALYIKDQDNGVDLLIAKKDNPRWREITLLWCSMSDVTPFVSRLLECREDVLLSNLCLAGFCIGDKLRVSPVLLRRVCDKLYDYWWHTPFTILQAAFITALAASKDEKTVDRLIERFKDEDSDVRGSAAYALGQIGSEKAIEPLLERFKDEDSYVRGSAADALGQIGSEKAIEPLIERFKDEDSYVRGSAADALGQIGMEKAIEPLIERFKDVDSSVRGGAADARGQSGGEYFYFDALYPYLEKHKVYIDILPPEVIERNKFWKENFKTDPIC
jgi:energy-coupling factor transporter ATP-binding protein EcfA2